MRYIITIDGQESAWFTQEMDRDICLAALIAAYTEDTEFETSETP